MNKDVQDDRDLFAAFVRGDRAALGEIAKRYEHGMHGMAYGLLGADRAAAADAVQETWVRVIRSARTFDGRSSVKTWMYRILINQCVAMRARDRSAHGVHAFAPLHDAENPGLAASGAEFNARLRAAVERLPEDRRTLTLLCYHSGMTHEQAAETLGIPLGTLKSRLHATLTSLRAALLEEAKA